MRRSQANLIKRVTGSAFSIALTVVFLVVFIFFLGRAIRWGFNFGYSIFNEPPINTEEVKVVEYTVQDGEGIREIARDLEKLGLIRDANVMVVQKLIYQYTIYPGTYTLSTSMQSKDMLERIGTAPEKTGEEEEE